MRQAAFVRSIFKESRHMKLRLLSLILLIALALVGVVPLAGQDSAFPVTVEHQYGTTTIDAPPQRVVSIGYTEQDALLALGITPVAVRYWYGPEELTVRPWAQPYIEGDAPVVLNMPYGGLNYEAILALDPDLISAVTSGITQEEYDLLSAIAPTITQTGDYINFGMPWQEATQLIGDAVGKSQEAAALVAEVEAMFTDARTRNPQFAGKTVSVTYNFDTYGFYTAQDSRGRFFTELGFVIPAEHDAIAGDLFYATISDERMDLLDQDLIAFVNLQDIEGGREGVESDPLFAQLEAVQDGRVLYMDEVVENALHFTSPISLPFALEGALPALEAIFPPEVAAAQTMCETGFRPFTHVMGETCIPAEPQRVVVLDTGELDNALALGAPLVGAPVNDAMLYQEYLIGQLDGIADIGAIGTPSLEAILATAPDLIIGSRQRYEGIYDQLAQIAPTVLTESLRVPWQDNFAVHAAALNRTAEAEALLMQYDAQTAALREALGDAIDTTTISVIRFRPGQVRLYLKSSYIGYILQDIGLPRPASQDENTFSLEISLEDVRAVDAEYIFITGYAQDDSDLQTFLESPLWQTLSAVQNERAIDVNDDTWIAGLGVQSAFAVLDDLAQLLGAAIPSSPFANS
jgi:iron complex transport system substrate-binding protein